MDIKEQLQDINDMLLALSDDENVNKLNLLDFIIHIKQRLELLGFVFDFNSVEKEVFEEYSGDVFFLLNKWSNRNKHESNYLYDKYGFEVYINFSWYNYGVGSNKSAQIVFDNELYNDDIDDGDE